MIVNARSKHCELRVRHIMTESRLKSVVVSHRPTELSATDRLRKLIEEDENLRKTKKDRERDRRSEEILSDDEESHKKKKKKEKQKSKKHKKKKHKKNKSSSPDISSSDDSAENEPVHPILQRQRHKLWG